MFCPRQAKDLANIMSVWPDLLLQWALFYGVPVRPLVLCQSWQAKLLEPSHCSPTQSLLFSCSETGTIVYKYYHLWFKIFLIHLNPLFILTPLYPVLSSTHSNFSWSAFMSLPCKDISFLQLGLDCVSKCDVSVSKLFHFFGGFRI